jgi:hypothetical protein
VKSLSIEDALQWTQRFAAREWKLLLPVALAFLALPPMTLGLLLPARIADAPMTPQALAPLLESAPWLMPAELFVALVTLVGALAIVALALIPRVSVREALALAFQRLLVFVLALIVVTFFVVIVATVAAIPLQLARLAVPVQQAILFCILIGLGFFLWIRLIALGPVVIASRAGPIAAIRLAWELSAGAFWRLLGAALVYGVGGTVVVAASAFALGTLFVIGAKAAGLPDLGPVLYTIYLRLVGALFWTGFHILVVALYRQLGGSIRGT